MGASLGVAQFNTAHIISFVDIKLGASLCLRASVVPHFAPQRHGDTKILMKRRKCAFIPLKAPF